MLAGVCAEEYNTDTVHRTVYRAALICFGSIIALGIFY